MESVNWWKYLGLLILVLAENFKSGQSMNSQKETWRRWDKLTCNNNEYVTMFVPKLTTDRTKAVYIPMHTLADFNDTSGSCDVSINVDIVNAILNNVHIGNADGYNIITMGKPHSGKTFGCDAQGPLLYNKLVSSLKETQGLLTKDDVKIYMMWYEQTISELFDSDHTPEKTDKATSFPTTEDRKQRMVHVIYMHKDEFGSFKDSAAENVDGTFTNWHQLMTCEMKQREDTSTEDALRSFSKTSVLFVSISFIILMVISLAWLVFYYVQRFRYAHAKDRLARRLFNAAKKALTKIPTRALRQNDRELDTDCPVCIEPYICSDIIRILPCKHIFHKTCVDPWLLEHRTCPMCKSDILKAFGYSFGHSGDSVRVAAEEGDQLSNGTHSPDGQESSSGNGSFSYSGYPYPLTDSEYHDPFFPSPSTSPSRVQQVIHQNTAGGFSIIPLTVHSSTVCRPVSSTSHSAVLPNPPAPLGPRSSDSSVESPLAPRTDPPGYQLSAEIHHNPIGSSTSGSDSHGCSASCESSTDSDSSVSGKPQGGATEPLFKPSRPSTAPARNFIDTFHSRSNSTGAVSAMANPGGSAGTRRAPRGGSGKLRRCGTGARRSPEKWMSNANRQLTPVPGSTQTITTTPEGGTSPGPPGSSNGCDQFVMAKTPQASAAAAGSGILLGINETNYGSLSATTLIPGQPDVGQNSVVFSSPSSVQSAATGQSTLITSSPSAPNSGSSTASAVGGPTVGQNAVTPHFKRSAAENSSSGGSNSQSQHKHSSSKRGGLYKKFEPKKPARQSSVPANSGTVIGARGSFGSGDMELLSGSMTKLESHSSVLGSLESL